MDAVVEAAGREVDDGRLERLELPAERLHAVDDEEHVTVRIVVHVGSGRCSVRLERIKAAFGHYPFAALEQRYQLRDRAPYDLGLAAGRDSSDVRQPGQAGERAPAEVETVELHVGRVVGQRQAAQQSAQQRALAALRAADDRGVAAGARQVGLQDVMALFERTVHDADGHSELAERSLR